VGADAVVGEGDGGAGVDDLEIGDLEVGEGVRADAEGSHMAHYDDEQVYVEGLLAFLRDTGFEGG
jgi:hypothetical protein